MPIGDLKVINFIRSGIQSGNASAAERVQQKLNKELSCVYNVVLQISRKYKKHFALGLFCKIN